MHLGGAATGLHAIGAGRLPAARRPRYWYNSRRRYFVRTGGGAYALAAGLAYLAGRLLWQIRCLATGRADNDPKRSTRDFIAYGLCPRPSDKRADLATFATLAGSPPANQPGRA
jgi:hypothetical protein